MARVELRSLSKRFGSAVAVSNFSLAIDDGHLVSFLGPSGCGKTTTLRMTAGFERPDTGQVLVDDHDLTALPPNRRNMGMVFQGYALFPNMTAAQNIEFGLTLRRRPAEERRRRVTELLETFGLAHVGRSYPHQMSGGQQQRVALARAIATEPAVLLLDEPLSAVDAKVREELRTEIRRLQANLGITTILVTHDQAEALSISDRVVVMNRGAIEEVGTPAQIYGEPRTSFTAAFIGAMNEIPVRVVSTTPATVERGGARVVVSSATGVRDGEPGLLLVRPESIVPHLSPTAAGGASAEGLTVHGRIDVMTFLGATTRLVLSEAPHRAGQPKPATSALQRLAVDVPSATAARWAIGATLTVTIPPGACRVIAAPVAA